METPCSSMNGTEHFLDTDVNALSLVEQSMEFEALDNLSSFNTRLPSEQIMRSSFSNQCFNGMMNAFSLSGVNQIREAFFPADFTLENKHMETNFKEKKRRSISECGGLLPESPRTKSADAKQQNQVSSESVRSPKEGYLKIQKSELLPAHSSSKSTIKHVKEISHEDDDPNEAYIHVRAKRGKATNSHSLAERVRREKISERMRILQDLVPGCNKITGKAVMLDEIINYVQSLQQQVEFLSMKLSAVNPELNFDIEQIFSKAARDGTPAFLGLGPGFSTPHTNYHTISQLSSMAQYSDRKYMG